MYNPAFNANRKRKPRQFSLIHLPFAHHANGSLSFVCLLPLERKIYDTSRYWMATRAIHAIISKQKEQHIQPQRTWNTYGDSA